MKKMCGQNGCVKGKKTILLKGIGREGLLKRIQLTKYKSF